MKGADGEAMASGTKRKVVKKTIAAAVIFFCAVLLIDGLVDLLFSVSGGARESARLDARLQDVVAGARKAGASLPEDLTPFTQIDFEQIGGTQSFTKAMNAGEVVVGPLGRRLAPGEPLEPEKPRILVFGASQVFGLYNRAGETVAANLERLLPDVAFMNYGANGQTMEDSAAYLEYLLRQGVTADGVVVIGGAMEPLLYCVFDPLTKAGAASQHKFRLLKVYERLDALINPARQVLFPCSEGGDAAEAVVDRTIASIHAMIGVAHARNLEIAVFMLPRPWDEGPDLSNIQEAQNFDLYTTAIGRTAELLVERLGQNPIPHVHDVTGAFDGKPAYFLDAVGHISDEGQRVLAQAIHDILVGSRGMTMVSKPPGGEPPQSDEP